MKRYLLYFLLLFAFACKHKEHKVIEKKYEDGSPRIVSVYEDNDTTKNKIGETQYYNNGKILSDGKMKSGLRDGLWVSYYDNGQKWSENNYKNGVLDGKTTTWYPNGKPQYVGAYKDNVPFGKWKFWAQNGVDVIEKDYSK